MGYFSDSFSQFNGGFSVLEEQSLCEKYNFTSTEPEQDQLDGGTETKNENRKRVIALENTGDSGAGSSSCSYSNFT